MYSTPAALIASGRSPSIAAHRGATRGSSDRGQDEQLRAHLGERGQPHHLLVHTRPVSCQQLLWTLLGRMAYWTLVLWRGVLRGGPVTSLVDTT